MVAVYLLTRLLAGLDPAQRRAVLAPPGPLIVVAGPGTGKTRVLAHRVAYAIARGRVDPSEVLAITFTNKAARELSDRVAALLGRDEARVTVGTFHAVAHRLVRGHAERVGRTPRYSIYDQAAAARLLGEAIGETGLEPRAAGRAIARAKAHCRRPADLGPADGPLAAVWARYEELLAAADALDFDDLIARAVGLLREPAILAATRERWRIVLIDEYQDCNPAQAAWALALAGRRGNLTAVADDDQAIYGFRSAESHALTRLGERLEGARTIALDRAYRCTPEILTAAGALIAANPGRAPKPLAPQRPPGRRVVELRAAHAAEEAERVTEWALARRAEGARPAELAVLSRTRAALGPVERVLLAAGLPVRTLGAGGFLARAEIRDALAHLALAANPRDRVAFARALTAPRRGVGPVARAAVVAFAAGLEDGSLLAACARAEEVAELTRPQRRALTAYATAMAEASRDPGPLPRHAGAIIAASGLPAALLTRGAEGAAACERLRDLVRATRRYATDHPDAGLAELLGHLALLDDERGRAAAVTLATVHAAKGLEWSHVWIVGLTDGVFPHARAGADGIEEERRLAYVGFTRARESLTLSWPMRTYGRPERRSRFLAEALDAAPARAA